MNKRITILFSFLLLSFGINSQSKKITIKVKNQRNKPIAGAIILIDDIKQDETTNFNGVFKTRLHESPKTISAFHPEIGITKIAYNGKDKINIYIRGGSKELNTKNATNEVSGNSIQFNSIYDYLRGKVSGVNISADNVIRVRGYNSFSGNMDPLFVLNNIEVPESVFAAIDPNEVKKVTILKGPDSSSYGVRGANGVILIKTK
tara:strand:- start:10525 stop:11136 length:612 start_codon:yes stop_codon:yes gene_type:complete